MISRRHLLNNTALLGAGLVLGGSGLLSGCDGAAPASQASGQGTGQPQYGGRLRLGIIDGNQSGNLDAHKPVGSGIVRGFALYSKLWEWDENMQPRLALAEAAEVSPDAKTWTLRLRQDLEFHHGKTIDADDLIFSIRRLTDPQLASPYAALLHWVDRDNLVKLDKRTVRLSFRDGRSYFPLAETWVNFGGIVPVDYHPVTNPVGAGPYKLKSFTPGQPLRELLQERQALCRRAGNHRFQRPDLTPGRTARRADRHGQRLAQRATGCAAPRPAHQTGQLRDR